MKKFLVMTLTLALLFCGCGKQAAPAETVPALEVPTTAAPTTEPTTVPTTQPAPVYRNPLSGVQEEEPFTSRPFAFSIGNTRESFPHYGVSKCDILFEAFVNGLTTRRFAMYADVRNVEAIGGIRSMRVQWTDLCQGYNAIGVHAAGSNYVMGDMRASGIDNINGEQWDNDTFHYRDKDRMRKGFSMEHCLFEKGPEIVAYAESVGMAVTIEPDKDYGLRFSETPASEGGETAEVVNITFQLSGRKKPTIMTYDPASGCYTMMQYENKLMTDGYYGDVPELYKNVFTLFFNYHTESGIYHVCETVGEGEGFFACNGKIIPIRWHRDSNETPFYFTLSDGTPLEQGIGPSYMAMLTTDSTVAWEASDGTAGAGSGTAGPGAAKPAEPTVAMAETVPADAEFDPSQIEVG